MALVTTSAVAAASPLSAMVRSREPTSGGSSRAPVASTKNVSPSFRRWDGRTARAKPLWAAPASRWASARCSTASVATTPMVVLSGGGGGGQGQRAARGDDLGARRPADGRVGREERWRAVERTGRRVVDAARGVDGDQRGDRRAVLEDHAGRADAPGERPGRGPRCRPDAPLDDRGRPPAPRPPVPSPRSRTPARGDGRTSHPGRGRRGRRSGRSGRPGGDQAPRESPRRAPPTTPSRRRPRPARRRCPRSGTRHGRGGPGCGGRGRRSRGCRVRRPGPRPRRSWPPAAARRSCPSATPARSGGGGRPASRPRR